MGGSSMWSAVRSVVVLFGTFQLSFTCRCPDATKPWNPKNLLFVSHEEMTDPCVGLPEGFSIERDQRRLCISVSPNSEGCCDSGWFDCPERVDPPPEGRLALILTQSSLVLQDIVVMKQEPKLNAAQCHKPSNTDSLLNAHKNLNLGQKNIRLTQSNISELCRDNPVGKALTFQISVGDTRHNVACEPLVTEPEISIDIPDSNTTSSPGHAANLIKNLSSVLELMGNASTAAVTIGEVKGVVARLPPANQKSFSFGITANRDVNILEGNGSVAAAFNRTVYLSKEACSVARRANATFAVVLIFPGIKPDDPTSSFFGGEIVGIELGARVVNLSEPVKIQFHNAVETTGRVFLCRSWDGEGNSSLWIPDGCVTERTSDSVTCVCSHLTFFGLLMSPTGNLSLSSAHLQSLTYITSVGCGLSVFLLVVALTMHCLLRRKKASLALWFLVQLLAAILFLNVFFLVNESLAGLGNRAACVAAAAALHYSLLATFSWFFMQALNLLLLLYRTPGQLADYRRRICCSGWGTPLLVVVVLLGLQKYDRLVIDSSGGGETHMCWIPDAAVQQGVNLGLYGVVFVFTLSVFVVTLQPIVGLNSVKKKQKVASIFGLFFLFGLGWAAAFFSHGALLLPAYYAFTAINAFQGFFLFFFYYWSSRLSDDDQKLTSSKTTSATTDQ